MGTRRITLRMGGLLILGCMFTVCCIKFALLLWNQNFGYAALYLAGSSALFLLFFRQRKIILAVISLSFVLVSAGMTAIFHPSLVGFALTFGSALGLYLIIWWSFRKFPSLTPENWEKAFYKDP